MEAQSALYGMYLCIIVMMGSLYYLLSMWVAIRPSRGQGLISGIVKPYYALHTE